MTPDLLPLEEAVAVVLRCAPALGNERVGLEDAAGRVLARSLVAPRELPPHAASLMDGYAVRAADGIEARTVAFEIAAGQRPIRPLLPGECARIFTGALLPEGADAVVMQEQATRDGERLTFDVTVQPGAHVRAAGSDAHKDDVLVPAGVVLDAGGVSLAAALGFPFLDVGRAPRVALLATGDELRLPGETLPPEAVYESNTFGLAHQVRQAGARPLVLGLCPDDPVEIAARLAASGADVLLTSGGASVGDYDYAREVLTRLGGRAVFWQVAIRPGRPVLFGLVERAPSPPALFFALPGNPAASALTFDLFVRPALLAMQQATRTRRVRLTATLASDLSTPPKLTYLVRGRLTQRAGRLNFEPAHHQGSMSITSLSGLGAVAIVPPGQTHLKAGSQVEVEQWQPIGAQEQT